MISSSKSKIAVTLFLFSFFIIPILSFLSYFVNTGSKSNLRLLPEKVVKFLHIIRKKKVISTLLI